MGLTLADVDEDDLCRWWRLSRNCLMPSSEVAVEFEFETCAVDHFVVDFHDVDGDFASAVDAHVRSFVYSAVLEDVFASRGNVVALFPRVFAFSRLP